MLEAIELFKGRVQTVEPVPYLRLVPMTKPQVTYIGELFETPKQRHQQEECLAALFRLDGCEKDDGLYAIPMETPKLMTNKFFLDHARKITSPLPSDKRWRSTYGANEFTYDPPSENIVHEMYLPELRQVTGVLDPIKKAPLRETIRSGILKLYSSEIKAEFN